MNIWKKLLNIYKKEINKYYTCISISKVIRLEDPDYSYLDRILDHIEEERMEITDKLFLLRMSFSKLCDDEVLLNRIYVMIQSEDPEMDKLLQVIIEQKLKECQKKRKLVSS